MYKFLKWKGIGKQSKKAQSEKTSSLARSEAFFKEKTIQRSKLALKAEQADEMIWIPKGCVQVKPEVNMALKFRWQCEKPVRAHSAYLGFHLGVSIRSSC